MVSHFDTSYHDKYRRPTYDSVEDLRDRQLQREFEAIFEPKKPHVPTPEEEVEYIDWLQEDFKSDQWLTYRFRKSTANPKRIPWKNMRQLKRQYQYNIIVHWALGALLTWPVAVSIGKLYQKTWHGVPLVPMNLYKHDFIDVSPSVYSRKLFKRYSLLASLTMGFIFAYNVVQDDGFRSDKYKNRPDMKPYPAMVKQDDDITTQTMYQSLYKKHSGRSYKQSSWYRFMFPNDADFTVKTNPYRLISHKDVFDPKKGNLHSLTNDFADHEA